MWCHSSPLSIHASGKRFSSARMLATANSAMAFDWVPRPQVAFATSQTHLG